MQVTDARVEIVARIMADDLKEIGLTSESPVANSDGTESPLWTTFTAVARRALTAALSDQERAVEVKALEWIYREQLVRTYCASDDRGDLYWINQSFGSDSYYFTTVRRHDGAILYDADDLEAAKAAAQADYEQRISSALIDVPAVEPVSNDLIGYVLRYGGMCRDCADMDGVCQSGQPCDTEQRRAVIKHTISALAYGIKHCFIANPFTSPPLSQEGEDSGEVERLTRPIVGIEHRTAQEVFDIMADRIRLAATRSGSATTQTGTSAIRQRGESE